MNVRHVLERLGQELEPHYRRAVTDQLRAFHTLEIDYCLEQGLVDTRASNSPVESDTGLLYVTRKGRRRLVDLRVQEYLGCLRKK